MWPWNATKKQSNTSGNFILKIHKTTIAFGTGLKTSFADCQYVWYEKQNSRHLVCVPLFAFTCPELSIVYTSIEDQKQLRKFADPKKGLFLCTVRSTVCSTVCTGTVYNSVADPDPDPGWVKNHGSHLREHRTNF